MNVKVYGLEWSVGADTTLTEFLNYLKSQNGDVKGGEVIGVTQKDDYWAGVFITIRDARTYFQLRKRGKGFQISVQRLEEGTSAVDLNFFILNPETGRGLYQYYYHSATLSVFGNHCSHRYMSFKTLYNHRGWLKQSTLVRPESIEKYTQRLSVVKSIEVEFASFTYAENEFLPVAEYANRIAHKAIFYQRLQKPLEVKRAILGFFKNQKDNLKEAKVTGIDRDGLEVTYRLLNDPDVYSEYDYEEFTKDVTLDTDDLEGTIGKSPNIKRLIELTKKPGIKQLLTARTK